MSPPPIPRMRKNEARGNQTQSDAIRCLSYGGHQRPTDAIRPQSDAISVPGALCFRVFVFWGGRKGLCFVFLCFGPAQRACVLCFCVLGRHNGPVFCVFVFWQTPLKTQQGVKDHGNYGPAGLGVEGVGNKLHDISVGNCSTKNVEHVWCVDC